MGPLAKLFCEPDMTSLLLGRGQLHGEIEEAIGIAFCVTLNETDELLCRYHIRLCIVGITQIHPPLNAD